MRGMTLLQVVRKPKRKAEAESAPSASSPDKTDGDTSTEVWETIELPKTFVRGRLALLVAIAVPLLILAVLGVRSAFADQTPQSTTAEIPAVATVDTAGVSSTAEYVARNWIALDDPTARTARLARVWADTDNPNWNGEGSLELKGTAYTVATEVLDDQRVDVTVAVYVSQGEDKGAWIGVLVPMQTTDGVASVRGAPKIVGLPEPLPIEPEQPVDVDSELSKVTLLEVERFFTAWGDGDASGVTAPGAEIPTPPANLGTVTVTGWDVLAGQGETRQGIAEVTYQIGEAQITSTYHVEITRVTSSAGADRWQVSTIA